MLALAPVRFNPAPTHGIVRPDGPGDGVAPSPEYFSATGRRLLRGRFDFSPQVQACYRQIFDLRIAEARAGLRQIDPANLLTIWLENYLDVLTIVAGDDEALYRRQVKKMEPRLAHLARGDRKSPWFLYCQAEVRLQWAVLRARYRDYLSSLNDIKQAYALLEQNQREHPDFKINLKSLGLIRALAANIPGEYRWAVQMLGGIDANPGRGARDLHSALRYARQQGWVLEREIQIACAFVQLHIQNDKSAAWQTLRSGSLDPGSSPLATYIVSSLAIRTARNDAAIQLLENCPRGPAYHPFPYLDYLLGIARLHRLDADADQPLLRFVQNFKGKNGLKEACQKLAWHRLVLDDLPGYRRYMQLVKTRGQTRSEPDQAAQREATRGMPPDPQLLRARLLFDGGYYRRAYELLHDAASSYRQNPRYALEYGYRLARIADELGRREEAARLYLETVAQGASEPWYYACSAALYLGILHEKSGETAQAKAAYRQCLLLNPDSYAAGLHARAKAGMNRLRQH